MLIERVVKNAGLSFRSLRDGALFKSLALATLVACSSNDVVPNPGSGGTSGTTGGVATGGASSGSGGASSGSGGTSSGSGGTSSPGGTGATAGSGGSVAAGAGGTTNAGSGGAPQGGDAGSGTGAAGSAGAAGGAGAAGNAGAGGAGGSPGGAGGAGGTGGGPISGLPAKSAVLTSLRLANDYFVGRWPNPTIDIVTDRTRPSNLWTRAVYYEGLMGLYAVETDMTRRTSYYDYAVRWASSPSHPWQLTNGSTASNSGDDQACGQTYLDLYAIDPQPVRIAQIRTAIDRMVTTQVTTVWTWIDAIQMAMPVFAKLGVRFDDPRYFDAMWALYSHTRNTEGGGLRNAANGLWWRDANFNPGGTYTRSPGGQDIYWSRGNGWVMAALVRVLDILPASDPHRATYLADFRAMAATLVSLQRTDGFWNESLTHPTHCASVGKTGQDGPETSGTALFAYGIGWGIRAGVLDRTAYGPVLTRAWNGLVTTALHTNGMLGWVQSTGAAPCETADTTGLGYDVRPNFDDYGVGCFLLAGSEVYRLAE